MSYYLSIEKTFSEDNIKINKINYLLLEKKSKHRIFYTYYIYEVIIQT